MPSDPNNGPPAPEFGHEWSRGSICGHVVRVDAWGAGPFVIRVDGKAYRFEDSDRFGPSLVTRTGAIRENPWPGERSPFWRAHRIWVRQGRRTEADHETCIWSEPKPHKVRRVDRRNHILIEAGEEDGRIEIISDAGPAEIAEFFKKREPET